MKYIPIGARKMWQGYWYIKVGMHGPGNWRLEHRIVMEQKLGRPLGPWEHVHHVNETKSDNRPENLGVHTDSTHMAEHNRVRGFLPRPEIACVGCGVKIASHPRLGMCQSCYDRRRKKADPEKIREWKRRWDANNPEKLKRQRLATYHKHREERLAKMRVRYERMHPGAKRRGATKPPNGWAFDYAACIKCGTNTAPHKCKGMCRLCYERTRQRRLNNSPPERWRKP